MLLLYIVYNDAYYLCIAVVLVHAVIQVSCKAVNTVQTLGLLKDALSYQVVTS